MWTLRMFIPSSDNDHGCYQVEQLNREFFLLFFRLISEHEREKEGRKEEREIRSRQRGKEGETPYTCE